jgi:hypothetical protein
MSVIVTFAVRVGPDRFLPEHALADADLSTQDYLYGRVLVSVPGRGEIFISDELIPLIASICFQAPTDLSQGQASGAYINRYPGEFYLEPIGPETRIHGSAVVGADGQLGAELTAPTVELLPALHDCGRRALAFFRRVVGNDPAQKENLTGVAALERETAEALSRP